MKDIHILTVDRKVVNTLISMSRTNYANINNNITTIVKKTILK